MVNEFCGFKNCVIGTDKLPADTTLNNMEKADLIKLLHIEQDNYETLMEFYNNVVKLNEKQLNGGGWIPCSERLPQEDEPEEALCEIVNITLKNGTVTVGWCNRYLEQWFVLDEHCDYPISRKYEDVLAWQPIQKIIQCRKQGIEYE